MNVRKYFLLSKNMIAIMCTVLCVSLCAGCSHSRSAHIPFSSACSSRSDAKMCIVTTTAILRDMVSHVAGDEATVTSIIPDNADPHSYEPSLAAIRNIVYADIAFSNYMLLEEHSIIEALDSNLRKGVPNIQLAEESVKNAADIIPMVEDVSLDTIWFGLATQRINPVSGQDYDAQAGTNAQADAHNTHNDNNAKDVSGNAAHAAISRSDQIRLVATDVKGPGDLFAYLTGTFGNVDIYFNSADGIDNKDYVDLPADAHTHLSWAFSKPGIYTLSLRADHYNARGEKLQSLGTSSLTFAVGVNARRVMKERKAKVVLSQGHADLAYDIVSQGFTVRVDNNSQAQNHTKQREYYAPRDVVVEVPSMAMKEIPAGRGYSFLGRERQKIYQLPQAVLGKHVHGDIDPHLWQSVSNGIAYVKTIADKLSQVDPSHESKYRAHAAKYIDELIDVDDYIRAAIAKIPSEKRNLVTTHDAFAYFGKRYGVKIAGFVTVNPASEPSIHDRKRLAQTLRDLNISAVFLEPNLASRSSVLQEVARENNVAICPIYGDAFDSTVRTYADMMRANADSMKRCLSNEK